MKRSGILNAELSALVAALGHNEILVVGDAGLPVPPGVRCLDLALVAGVPGFQQTVDALLLELVVDCAYANKEQRSAAPAAAAALDAAWPADVPLSRVSHAEIKLLSRKARAVIRTGEMTPYCNLVIRAGVPF